MLPATVTQHRGVPGISYCHNYPEAADTQRVLSILEWVQKATELRSIKKNLRLIRCKSSVYRFSFRYRVDCKLESAVGAAHIDCAPILDNPWRTEYVSEFIFGVKCR